MITGLMQQLIVWSVQLVDALGYAGVVFLMCLESSFFPWPSELVMPQAGYLASQGKMNLVIVIVLGVVGSWLGALFNYFLAMRLGRPFFLKYGKNFFCPPEKFLLAERFFLKHGDVSTFTGRLIPVVRHLISIPAGLTRMNMTKFLIYTGTGSAIWVSILAYIGYVCGQNMALVKKYSHQATLGVIAACFVIIGVYVWLHRRREARAAAATERH